MAKTPQQTLERIASLQAGMGSRVDSEGFGVYEFSIRVRVHDVFVIVKGVQLGVYHVAFIGAKTPARAIEALRKAMFETGFDWKLDKYRT